VTSIAVRPSALRTWLLAVRPATLPAAASGVAVGLGAALAVGAAFRLDTALGCLAVALLLQVVANLANDLSDFRRGAHGETRRIAPVPRASPRPGSSPSGSWRSRSGSRSGPRR
jgi:1,4-dihydroxy-2-naphthoate octaprenyltransferase